MIMQVLFSIVLRDVHVLASLLSWAVSTGALGVAIGMGRAASYYYIASVYVIISAYILMETRRYNIALYLATKELRGALKENEVMANQVHATEMRHMIANVAHDLKTPLTSFLSGIELISEVALDLQKKVKEQRVTSKYMQDSVLSILNCVDNIRSTNSFMLMTINRCIDYTKASKGLKLVPKYETIDLLETLSLPLHCMKDIQSRMEIRLEKIPKEICSHVITDKQWLQENVLCLLSNAVKYSSAGEVIIQLYLVPGSQRASRAQLNKKMLVEAKKRALSAQIYPFTTGQEDRLDSLEEGRDVNVEVEDDEDFITHIWPQEGKEGDQTEYIRIEIEDRGIGLSEEAMSNLFNPFKQAQRLAGGTGLGLYSLARRVEALSGYYGVEHRRDGEQGCMFWFSIPYRPDKVSASTLRKSIFPRRNESLFASIQQTIQIINDSKDQSAKHTNNKDLDLRDDKCNDDGFFLPFPALPLLDQQVPISTIASTEDSPSNKSVIPVRLDILIVDDSPAIVKMTSMMLKRLGHSITIAENGDVALKKIWERLEQTKTPFDVVLMDLQMPVMDGLEATRRLRSLESSALADDPTFTISPSGSPNYTRSNKRKKTGSINSRGQLATYSNDSQQSDNSMQNFVMNANCTSPTTRSYRDHNQSTNNNNNNNNSSSKENTAVINVNNININTAVNVCSTPCPSPVSTKRHQSTLRHQCVIGVSANSDHTTMQEALAAGVDAFMSKPFTIETFYDTYERMKGCSNNNGSTCSTNNKEPSIHGKSNSDEPYK